MLLKRPSSTRFRRSDGALFWVRSFISAQLEDASNVETLLALTIGDIDATMREQQRREADEKELKRLANVDSLTRLSAFSHVVM
jgi:hypothetical protein